MEIQKFTELDIKEAAELAFPIWGEEHAKNGKEFGLLMCEYIVRYGWLNKDYAFKIVENGEMIGCVLAGKITDKSTYNEWLDEHTPTMNQAQLDEALALRSYFVQTGPKVYSQMNADTDLYLSFFFSSKQGCGKILVNEIIQLAKADGYKNLYLWTDSSCNHEYYARNGYTLASKFKSNEWATDKNDYLTYIYKKSIE